MAMVRLHSMRDFFRIVFAWKEHSVMVFSGIIAVIMLFSYLYTPDYEITAKILILPQSTEAVVMSAGRTRNNIFPVSTQDINTEIELLTSTEVIRDTVSSFAKEVRAQEGDKPKGLGLKAVKNSWIDHMMDIGKYYLNELLIWLKLKVRLSPFEANVALLADAIEVEPVAMSNIILVTLTAEMPKVGTVVLNRMLDVYIAHHNKSFTKEEGAEFLNNESRSYFSRLEDAEARVKDYQKDRGIVDIRKQIETDINLLAEFTQDLKRNELALEALKSRIMILKGDIEKNRQGFVITRDMRMIPSVVELEKSIVPLLVSRSEMLKTYNPTSREIVDLDGQIESLRGEIRKEILKALKTDEMDMETLGVKRTSLLGQIEKLKRETAVLNQQEKNLKNLTREANMLESNYKLYSAKAEDARIYTEQKKQDLVNVRIADKAVVPAKPSFPNRILMLIISVFVGCFGALGTPFLMEFLDHRIKTSGDVENILSLPVLSYFTEEKLSARGEQHP